MLQALRSRLGSYFIKILFAVLVGSFAIWGIGDVVRAISNPDRPAVVAGNQEINATEIGRAFQNQVSQLRHDPRAMRLMEDLGTEPKVYYLQPRI